MNYAEKCAEFIHQSPTAYHAVARMKACLLEEGFTELAENEHWTLETEGKYFVTRGGSAIAAFTVPKKWDGFHIMASHSDSPMFKLKEQPEMEAEGAYIRLNVEKYGGMLMAPWFDRPLSIAGRIFTEDEKTGALTAHLVDLEEDACIIPNLAIHMNRDANNGYSYNPQKDLLPLYALSDSKASLMKRIAAKVGVAGQTILGSDLFVYNRTEPSVWGEKKEFISAPRLDDLECAFASLEGFLKGKKKEKLPIHIVFDNEEVGSGTRQGASATFLVDLLQRIEKHVGHDYEDYLIDLEHSYMISADNAHAIHPNVPEKADPVNRPVIGRGIVLKFNANQKYCTDGESAAMFRQFANKAKVQIQTFTNRSDVAGGSTLGNLSTIRVPLRTADIGLAQLAMHSPYETAGTSDLNDLVKLASVFFA